MFSILYHCKQLSSISPLVQKKSSDSIFFTCNRGHNIIFTIYRVLFTAAVFQLSHLKGRQLLEYCYQCWIWRFFLNRLVSLWCLVMVNVVRYLSGSSFDLSLVHRYNILLLNKDRVNQTLIYWYSIIWCIFSAMFKIA